MEYKPTIGLEIHAELNTVTKMFCNSLNDPDEVKPNVNVCPVCMAHPGTLPVINKEAVKHVIKVGVAIGANIAGFTEFDRKNYFYPDIPKGYQISQYKDPIVQGGVLAGVEITRIHLEEDTARSSHLSAQAGDKGDYSLVDFNRAGVPLMELVTEPVIHSAEEAGDFARELQLLLRTLGVSNANMEKGEMRVEVNISLSKTETFDLNNTRGVVDRTQSVLGLNNTPGVVDRTSNKKFDVLGTKVEVKNINSFKAAERAIEYEIKRQSKMLDMGEEIVQETRGWDEVKQITFSQRKKESSDDYRYFPDPDLPKLQLDEVEEFNIEDIKRDMPELPWKKRDRYRSLGIKSEDADMYTNNRVFGDFIDNVLSYLESPLEITTASNYISSDLAGLYKEDSSEGSIGINAERFAELIKMAISGKLSSRGVKEVLRILYERGGVPEEIAEANSLLQVRDEGAIAKIVEEVVASNPDAVSEYRGGKEASLKYLVGQGMKISRGSADPVLLEESIKRALS